MITNKLAAHFSMTETDSLLPLPQDNLALPIFSHGSMEIELYKPEKVDKQTPHSRDEIYIVITGSSLFFNGEKKVMVNKKGINFIT